MASSFIPPSDVEDGALMLDNITDYDDALLADSPPGIVGVYTDAGRHFSVVVGGHQITDGGADDGIATAG